MSLTFFISPIKNSYLKKIVNKLNKMNIPHFICQHHLYETNGCDYIKPIVAIPSHWLQFAYLLNDLTSFIDTSTIFSYDAYTLNLEVLDFNKVEFKKMSKVTDSSIDRKKNYIYNQSHKIAITYLSKEINS